jgi:hypothetical protein
VELRTLPENFLVISCNSYFQQTSADINIKNQDAKWVHNITYEVLPDISSVAPITGVEDRVRYNKPLLNVLPINVISLLC